MPVSTTHSCVGGMIGMAIALGGTDCVIWYKPVETFPYIGGVSELLHHGLFHLFSQDFYHAYILSNSSYCFKKKF